MTKKEKDLKPGYKYSPLGVIPEDWEIKKISDVGEVFSGGTPDTNNQVYWNGDINWCTPTDISALKGSKYLYGTTTKITREGINKSSANILPINSIIVCTRATIGKAAINKQPMSTNQGFKNIIPNNIDYEFLYYVILSEEFGLKKIANGSTFLEVSKTDFDNYKILVPPINEQKLISNILSNTDNLINQTQNLIKKFESRNKGLQQKLLTGKVRIKGYTDKWNRIKLGDVLEYYNKKTESDNEYEVLTSSKEGIFKQRDYYGANRITERDSSGFNIIPSGYITYRSRSDDGIFTFNINKYNFTGLVSKYYPVFKIKNGNNEFIVKYLNYY